MVAVIGFASPASAKPKEKKKAEKEQAPRTWKMVAEHVLKNGSEHPIKAPSSRTLGYDSDEVAAKTLRIKSSASNDKKEHSIRVTYRLSEKGAQVPNDLVLGTTFVETVPEGKKIDASGLRITTDGRIVSAMRATGVVGEVEQKVLAPDSPEAKEAYRIESLLLLKSIKLEQLTQ